MESVLDHVGGLSSIFSGGILRLHIGICHSESRNVDAILGGYMRSHCSYLDEPLTCILCR